jgi:DNA repair protein RecN (Recombination protein N)
VLKRKYGDSIDEILSYHEEIAEKIDGLENAEERSSELEGKIDATKAKLDGICAKLTDLRRKAAPKFQKAIEAQLADLAMNRTQFVVSIEPSEPGPKGADAVEFLISANPGEPVRPLAKIASGGEMSRIMLALKTVMARAEIPTLVFDEIDTGIGGRTAQVLGEKIASLALNYQILCVTHLPQIASRATHHYSVEKVVDGDRTMVAIRRLEGDDRVSEAEHAREMLSLADIGND